VEYVRLLMFRYMWGMHGGCEYAGSVFDVGRGTGGVEGGAWDVLVFEINIEGGRLN
jgi:hypothetical protein